MSNRASNIICTIVIIFIIAYVLLIAIVGGKAEIEKAQKEEQLRIAKEQKEEQERQEKIKQQVIQGLLEDGTATIDENGKITINIDNVEKMENVNIDTIQNIENFNIGNYDDGNLVTESD